MTTDKAMTLAEIHSEMVTVYGQCPGRIQAWIESLGYHAHLAPRKVSDEDVERAANAEVMGGVKVKDLFGPMTTKRDLSIALRAALQADRQRGGGVSFPAVFIGEIDGKHVGLHGSIESVEAIEALLAQRGQVREGFDWDAAWTLIRSFGYTTKGQTDELCDALESIFGKSPDSDAEGKENG